MRQLPESVVGDDTAEPVADQQYTLIADEGDGGRARLAIYPSTRPLEKE